MFKKKLKRQEVEINRTMSDRDLLNKLTQIALKNDCFANNKANPQPKTLGDMIINYSNSHFVDEKINISERKLLNILVGVVLTSDINDNSLKNELIEYYKEHFFSVRKDMGWSED